MKLPVLSLISLLAVTAASHAGSFGGPPPFTDMSPLQSGIDGSYQATCRGENLTGILRFAYENNVQSQLGTANTYNFFVAGQVVTGGVIASITGKQLAGVLGGQDFTVPTSSTGTSELPLVFIVRGNRANGEFSGQMNLEDKMSAFSGRGHIAPSTAETNTVIMIQSNNFGGIVIAGNNSTLGSGNVSVIPFAVPGSVIVPTDFTFEGVRTSIFAQNQGGQTTTTAAAATQTN